MRTEKIDVWREKATILSPDDIIDKCLEIINGDNINDLYFSTSSIEKLKQEFTLLAIAEDGYKLTLEELTLKKCEDIFSKFGYVKNENSNQIELNIDVESLDPNCCMGGICYNIL